MRAMVLRAAGTPLELSELERPRPGRRAGAACACWPAASAAPTCMSSTASSHIRSCRSFPATRSSGVAEDGRRLGVPWLGWTCGECRYCRSGRENLCDRARFTGYDIDGGYAEWTVADERFCFPLPDGYGDLEIAPLLCAGLIGYRSLRLAGDAERLGLYGFGSAAHIVAQVARWEGRRVFAVTREGDAEAQSFARSLGAEWAGAGPPPEELDAAIIFAPAGELVPAALRAVGKGGTRRLRGDPHVRHPGLSLRDPLGRAVGSLGREPDARATARSSSSSHRGFRSGPRSRRSRSSRPTRRSQSFVQATVRGSLVLIP